MNLSRLPFVYKLVVTLLLVNVVLALLFAHIQIRHAIEAKDGEPGMSMTDVRYYFSGDPSRRVLQAVLQAPSHWRFASAAERQTIEDWIGEGATREAYDTTIAPIMEARCVSCHSSEGERPEELLTTFEEVLAFTEATDSGVGYNELARISYVNIVLMTFLTALVVGLFYLTRFRGVWKQIIALVPVVAIFCNVLSWWSAKQSVMFVHMIVASSLALGVFVVLMVLLTLLDIWLLPEYGD